MASPYAHFTLSSALPGWATLNLHKCKCTGMCRFNASTPRAAHSSNGVCVRMRAHKRLHVYASVCVHARSQTHVHACTCAYRCKMSTLSRYKEKWRTWNGLRMCGHVCIRILVRRNLFAR